MKTSMRWMGLALSVSLALGVVSGCGDDDTHVTAGSGGKGGGGGKGGSGGKAGSGGKKAEPPLPTKDECIAMAKAMGSNPPALDCTCDKCTREIVDCQNDDGCLEIEQCALKTGCHGNDCYFSTPECMMIIDKWGSTGLSTTLATQLQDCQDTMCGTAVKTECPEEKINYMMMSLSLPGCCDMKTHLCGLNASTMGCLNRKVVGSATGAMFEDISCGLGDAGTADAGN